jgi:hypothetical protein
MVVNRIPNIDIDQDIAKNVFYYTLHVSCMRDVQGPTTIPESKHREKSAFLRDALLCSQ